MFRPWSLATNCSYAFIGLPELLSEVNVWRFVKACPEHKEIIDTYWKRKRVINLDKVLSRDARIVLRVMEECKNLKEVKFSRPEKHSKRFKELPMTISCYCPALEVLDIPGIPLSDNDLYWLSSLVSLKKVNINCIAVESITSLLDRMFLYNQQLEDVCIRHVKQCAITFKNLPTSVTKLEIEAKYTENLGDLFKYIDKWQLEKLWLPCVLLDSEQFSRLNKLTTLKSLYLCTLVDNYFFVQLFSNNPNLEYVNIIIGYPSTDYLKSFPNTITHLGVVLVGDVESNSLIEFAHKCSQLVSLDLSRFRSDLSNNIPNLVAQVPLLKELKIRCINADAAGLRTLQQLKHLKILWLLYLNTDLNAALTYIMSSCLELEVLQLHFVGFLLNEQVLDAIANLPVLKEIAFIRYNYSHEGDYIKFIHSISKRKSLTSVQFQKCDGFNNNAALTLIRECKTLTHLWIESSSIRADFIQETVRELNKQTSRRQVLYLTLQSDDEMTSQDLHSKLDLTTYSSTTYMSNCIHNNSINNLIFTITMTLF